MIHRLSQPGVFATLLSLLLITGVGDVTASVLSGGQPPVTASAATSARPWEVLPPTPAPVPGGKQGFVEANGARLAYTEYGAGAPVVFLHGGPANSDYWGNQVRALMSKRRVILIDTRGHGRSSTDGRPLGYDLFANDVVAVLDHLKLTRADLVGWSDGGVTALDLAMRYPERAGRIVAFGANTTTAGTYSDADRKPAFSEFLKRAPLEYSKLSPTPAGFAALERQLGDMYTTQPDWTTAQLRTIRSPVLIVDGEHDEAIRPEHTRAIAQAIPGAKLVFIPGTSHFTFLQQPTRFNTLLTDFLR